MAQALSNYAMSVFLLPMDISRDIERTTNKYWCSSSSKQTKGIHWQSWDRICKPKAVGGLGFRSLYDFNLALLGKQGWRLIQHPHSLVSRIYKARYYPHSSFLLARIGNSPSYVWCNIFATQDLIKRGATVCVGSGNTVSILNDP